ncbi:MAG TPA: FAD-binding oxidoreductase [Gemmatimonadaceae bacterium]|nr:FAD-binding oxidoreductase [Gemmatimonadaceae bacterium]
MKVAGFRGIYREDLPARAVYAEGAGIARAVPAAVAVPKDAADLSTLVAWAQEERVPLVPRGSGSGMAGGAVADGRAVIVDLSRFDQMAPVDGSRRRARAGAGVVRGTVEAAARAAGLRFPVDPSSGAFCTVGGMASTNAAGPHTLRFGSMRHWVMALDCVFADGARATVRRGDPPPREVSAVARMLERARPAILAAPRAALSHPLVRKDSSGYALGAYAESGELVDLLVGSEGTLALFVAVEVALLAAPGATSGILAEFPSLEAAAAGAATAREAGASMCELLDRTFLDVAAGGDGTTTVAAGTDAVLLMEVEGESAERASSAATMLAHALRKAGATDVRLALDPVTEQALWALRHAASPILSHLDPALKSMQFIEDAAVPPDRLPDYVRGVRTALATRGIRGVIFGHAGDAHVHVNPLIDVRRAGWREQIRSLLDEVTALVVRLGGTLTGEHGDGRLRTPLLDRAWDPTALALFRLVKECFDPAGILNPGVKIPLPGQVSAPRIKYDPDLPPLPAPAPAILEEIDRERAWNRDRLSFLNDAE